MHSDRPHALIVGAGLSGATVARSLAEAGWLADVWEREATPGGMCLTNVDARTGILVHRYGPHIFHTDDHSVWRFVSRFARMVPYVHKVQARLSDRTYPLPITLDTMTQFFGRPFEPEEARAFIDGKRIRLDHPPRNFTEQALSMFGREIYEAFFLQYTRKQWGRDPDELPASVLKRLPLRFDRNPNYFSHALQGIPADGYTEMIYRMLDHPSIHVRYGSPVTHCASTDFDHVVYTGPLDEWFEHRHGRLPYRTIDFDTFIAQGDFQGCAQVNYCGSEVPFTRITEHKHLAPWQSFEETVVSREFSRETGREDKPFYPVRLASFDPMLSRYLAAAGRCAGCSFIGRLATFRYIDMDVAVAEALQGAREISTAHADHRPVPSLFSLPAAD